MKRPLSSRLLGLLVLGFVAASAPAHADEAADRNTARELAGLGQDALEQKDYPRARELYGRALALLPAPTLALGVARADVGLGRLVAAHERYVGIVRQGAPADNAAATRAVEDAKVELAALKPRIPGLILRVRGVPGAVLTLDGEPYPDAAIGIRRSVDPGRHLVRATSARAKATEKSVEVAEGATAEVTLDLVLDLTSNQPDPPPAKDKASASAPTESGMSGMRIAGITIGSVGLASLGVSAVTGGLYWNERSAVDERCTAELTCDAEGFAAAQSAETLGLVNTITFFAGLAVTGVGTTLFFVGADDDSPEVAIGPGPGLIGLSVGGSL